MNGLRSAGFRPARLFALASLCLIAAALPAQMLHDEDDYGCSDQSSSGKYFLYAGGRRIGAAFAAISLPGDGIVFTHVSRGKTILERGYFDLRASRPLAVPAGVGEPADSGPFISGRARFLPRDEEALYGYIGVDGAWAVQPRFLAADDFDSGFAAVQDENGLWGVIDVSGDYAYPPRLKDKPPVAGGIALAEEKGKKYAFDLRRKRRSARFPVLGFEALPPAAAKAIGRASVLLVRASPGRPGGSLGSLYLPDGTPFADCLGPKGAKYRGYEYKLGDEVLTLSSARVRGKGGLDRSYDLVAFDYHGSMVFRCADDRVPAYRYEVFPDGYARRESYASLAGELGTVRASLLRPDGSTLIEGMFNSILDKRGDLIVAGFGNSFRGAFGLFDVRRRAFVIPPNKRSIAQQPGASLWLVEEFDGSCSLFDQARMETAARALPKYVIRISGDAVYAKQPSESDLALAPFPKLEFAVGKAGATARSGPDPRSKAVASLAAGRRGYVVAIDAAVSGGEGGQGFWMKARVEGSPLPYCWVFSRDIDFTIVA